MKKTVTRDIEIKTCDFCGLEEGRLDFFGTCTRCGKHLCRDCKEKKAIEYKPGVYHGGTCDGLYCLECDRQAFANDDPLNRAYREIMALRDELDVWSKGFRHRQEAAESRINAIAGRLHPNARRQA